MSCCCAANITPPKSGRVLPLFPGYLLCGALLFAGDDGIVCALVCVPSRFWLICRTATHQLVNQRPRLGTGPLRYTVHAGKGQVWSFAARMYGRMVGATETEWNFTVVSTATPLPGASHTGFEWVCWLCARCLLLEPLLLAAGLISLLHVPSPPPRVPFPAQDAVIAALPPARLPQVCWVLPGYKMDTLLQPHSDPCTHTPPTPTPTTHRMQLAALPPALLPQVCGALPGYNRGVVITTPCCSPNPIPTSSLLPPSPVCPPRLFPPPTLTGCS